MNNKVYNIQALRGLAVFFVVCYHVIPIEHKYNPDFIIIPDFFRIGNMGVDIFFIISGYIMVTVTYKYIYNKDYFYKFIYSRFSRIYPLYWFYSLLLLPLLFIKPEWINSSQKGNVDLLSSFLLLPDEFLPLIMVGWSLIHEIYFYVIFGLFILFFNKNQLLYFAFFWAISIILAKSFISFHSPMIDLITNPLTIEFIFGILIGIYYITNSKYDVFKLSKVSLYFLLIISLLIVYSIVPEKVNDEFRVLYYGLPSMIIIFFSIEAEKHHILYNKFFILIGDASYSIYLAHLLTLNVVAKFFNIFSYQSLLFELFMVMMMLVATLIWGLASYKYIEVPLIKYTKSFYKSAA